MDTQQQGMDREAGTALTLRPSTSPLALSPDDPSVPISWVEDLFGRLSAILGGAMANVYAAADPELVKAEWSQALVGFNRDEVRRGLAACRTRKFAPNLGEFLHLCRPSLDPEVAWHEAAEGLKAHSDGKAFAWSHPAVYWACRELQVEIRAGSFAAHRKRWEHRLGEWFAAGQWATIPDPTARRITQQSYATQASIDPMSSDEAVERMRQFRARKTGFKSKADEQAARGEPDAEGEQRDAA